MKGCVSRSYQEAPPAPPPPLDLSGAALLRQVAATESCRAGHYPLPQSMSGSRDRIVAFLRYSSAILDFQLM